MDEHELLLQKLCSTTFLELTSHMRATAIGVATAVSQSMGLVSPYIFYLDQIWDPLTFLVIGTVALISSFMVFTFLPETLNKDLPHTKEDALKL